MRFVVLLVLLAIGSALLYLARYRYQAVNMQMASLHSVEGTVDSVDSGGDLNIKYSVDGTPYDISRSVPVKFFPSLGVHDKVTLIYAAARPDSARVKHWSVVYPDTAITGGFGIAAIIFAFGAFVMMGSAPALPQLGALRDGQEPFSVSTRTSSLPVVTSLNPPIDLKNAGDEFYLSFVLSAASFVAAFLIYRNPDFLGSKLIGYPAAVVAGILGVAMIFAAFQNRSLRVHADDNGVQWKDNSESGSFLWQDVASLKHVTVTRSFLKGNHSIRRRYFSTKVSSQLLLLSAAGKVLYKIHEDDPMEPAQDWLRLRSYIPRRTNLPVQEETSQTWD